MAAAFSPMRIVLARHGRPQATADDRRPIPGTDIGRWTREYNERGLARSCEPPARLREAAQSAEYIVASDLRRAAESAIRLAGAREIHFERDLREAGLPETLNTTLRLHPGAWVVVARLAWLLNRCDADETAGAARRRAARVAERLNTLAHVHTSLLVVGHGWFNRLVATELRRQQWRGPRVLGGGYWSSATYERPCIASPV